MTDNERAEIHDRLAQLETEVKANTELTTGLKADVSELLDILSAGKSGLRVLGVLGAVLKWTAGIVTAVAAIWAALHQGGGIK
jgi:hypothetical protein